MNDTTASVQAEFRMRLRATDATQRLRMMSGMFSAARSLSRSSVGDEAGSSEIAGAALFRRMYRTDFDAGELEAIAEHLKATRAD